MLVQRVYWNSQVHGLVFFYNPSFFFNTSANIRCLDQYRSVITQSSPHDVFLAYHFRKQVIAFIILQLILNHNFVIYPPFSRHLPSLCNQRMTGVITHNNINTIKRWFGDERGKLIDWARETGRQQKSWVRDVIQFKLYTLNCGDSGCDLCCRLFLRVFKNIAIEFPFLAIVVNLLWVMTAQSDITASSLQISTIEDDVWFRCSTN